MKWLGHDPSRINEIEQMRQDEPSDENPKSKISIAIPKTDLELCGHRSHSKHNHTNFFENENGKPLCKTL